MAEKLWFIKNCDLFELLTAEQLARLEPRCRLRVYPKGSLIYLPTDPANGVLLLAEGRVKLCGYTADGKQSILAFIEPGELFGELALLETDAVREEHAEAVAASSVVLIPAAEVQRLMAESSQLALGVTKLIGLRRRRIERRLRYLLFRSSRDRLVNLLIELAERYGRRTADGLLLSVKLSHQDLACIIGSTRETVTVLLGELQLAGFIRVRRQQITIRDLPGLTLSADTERPPDARGRSRAPEPRAVQRPAYGEEV
jgi:CRP-like cAMP-binding protein